MSTDAESKTNSAGPQAKKQKMSNQLEGLKEHTIVVADTGDIEAIRRLQPTDATTNPTLLLAATQNSSYAHLVDDALQYGREAKVADQDERVRVTMDKLNVNFGKEILSIVPGLVSTELDARLSFDTNATVERARQIIRLYKEVGIDKERVLIKIASTWEGFCAAKVLEGEGIHCNMTLLFNFAQAVAAAEAGVTLVSPFVGRIMDWYKQAEGVSGYEPQDDPGVKSVTKIYNYYKKNGYKTVVMGASFRNKHEVLHLAGCDKLTISPALLEELQNSNDPVQRYLSPETAQSQGLDRVSYNESQFRFELNEDAMATEKLAEGIRKFSADIVKLENTIRQRLA